MSLQRTVIEPERSTTRYWAELWQYRELMAFMAWRDIKVRYRQALLGAGWALIQPLLQTVLLTFVFSNLAGMRGGAGTPYPLMVLAGLLPWQFFSAAFSGSSASLAGNSHLITKVYFPRLVVPLSSLAVAAADLGLMLVFALPLCLFLAPAPGWPLLLLPLFILNTGLLAIGAGLWSCALSIRHRDLRFIIPFLLQIGLFATPVGYRSDLSSQWHDLLALNPLTASVEGFRWCLLGGEFTLDARTQLISVALTAALLLSGLWLFRRSENHLADTL